MEQPPPTNHTSQMYGLLYISDATVPVDEVLLQSILGASDRFNPKHAISGILINRGEQFMQLLEGEEAQVQALYHHISKDTRHTNVKVLHTAHLSKRNFSVWRMCMMMVNNDRFNALYADYILKLTKEEFKGAAQHFYTHLMRFITPEDDAQEDNQQAN